MNGWVWGWLLSTVLVLILLGWLAALLAQGWIGQPHEQQPERSARQILEDRYVRGEIDTTEYQRRRADLP